MGRGAMQSQQRTLCKSRRLQLKKTNCRSSTIHSIYQSNRSLNHGRRDSKLSRRSDFQRAWSFSCAMVLHAEAVSTNILHGKAVRFSEYDRMTV